MKLEASALVSVAAICASILVAILNKWWDPIAAHIGFPFGVDRRVKKLQRKVKDLTAIQKDLLHSDPFPSSAERIRWLKSVDDLKKKHEDIENSLRLAERGLIWFTRCKISRETETELITAEDLITHGRRVLPKVISSLTRRSRELIPAEQASLNSQVDRLLPVVQAGLITQFDILVPAEELPVPSPLPGMESPYNKVLNFIKDNRRESAIMGVWGMGGVGKTTLINLVRDSRPSQYQDYFLEVVFVRSGKGCTEVADLQKVIAISMELETTSTETTQAQIISRHLKNKDFLLFLDDLWEGINLEDLGIPSLRPQPGVLQPPRRKVVFTTRRMDVCTRMGCRPKNIIQMKCLNKHDSWNLFAQYVGNTILGHAEIQEIAKEIVEDCSGLPMALCTIGKLMSTKNDSREWRTARDMLKESKLHKITVTHELQRLQQSYDNLRADMKEGFLICLLWPENENISMKILIRWWTGLGLLDEASNASDSGYTLINDLVRESVLEKGDTGLDSTEHSHVKMHSMVRKMAIGIVNEHGNKNRWLPNSLYRSALEEEKWRTVEKAWISQEDTLRWHQWSPKARFPELKMLVAQHMFSLKLICFFQNITFLDLEGMKRKEFPWKIICKLIKLQHLNLSATKLHFLPELMENLSELKYLYIRKNWDLQKIPTGLILALKRLRGLDLFCSGASYEVLQELASSTIYSSGYARLYSANSWRYNKTGTIEKGVYTGTLHASV